MKMASRFDLKTIILDYCTVVLVQSSINSYSSSLELLALWSSPVLHETKSFLFLPQNRNCCCSAGRRKIYHKYQTNLDLFDLWDDRFIEIVGRIKSPVPLKSDDARVHRLSHLSRPRTTNKTISCTQPN